jgi:PAS domain S-box-containing protein
MRTNNRTPDQLLREIGSLKARISDLEESRKDSEIQIDRATILKEVYHHSAVGIIKVSLDFKIISANSYFSNLLGYREDELIGKSIYDISAPDIDKADMALLEKVTKGDLDYHRFERVYLNKDGEKVHCLADISKVRNEQGDPIFFVGSVIDISNQKEVEAKLIKTKNDWINIFNSLSDPTFLLNTNYEIEDANNAALTVLNKKKEEILGQKCYKLLHNIDEPAENCPTVRLKKSVQPELEQMVVDVLDKSFLVSVSPVLDSSGKLEHIIHHAKDVTNIKALESELAHREKKIRSLFNGIGDAVFVSSFQSRDEVKFVEVNEIACERYGYSREEFYKLTPKDITLEEHFQDKKKVVMEILRKSGKYTFETLHITKKGRKFPVEVNANIIDYSGEKMLLSVVRDITERKAAIKARDESEARNKAILQAIPDLMFIQNKEGEFLDYHASDKNKLYMSPDKFIGKNIKDVFPPEFADSIITIIEKALKDKTLQIYDYSMTLENQKQHFEARIVPFSKNKALSIVRDITEKRNSEQVQNVVYRIAQVFNSTLSLDSIFLEVRNILGELLNTETFYIALYNEVKDLLDIHFHIGEEASFKTMPATGTLSGYIVKSGKQIFADEATIRSLLNKGVLDDSYKDENLKQLIGVPLRMGDKIFGLMAVVSYDDPAKFSKHDLEVFGLVADTVSIGIEHKLNEEKYRALFDNINVGVALHEVISDADNKMIDFVFLDVNPAYEKLVNKKKIDLIGKYATDILPESVKKLYPVISEVVNTNVSTELPTISLFKDRFHEIKIYSPRKNQFAVAVTDVTDRVRITEELKNSEERLKILFEYAPDAYYITDLKGKFLDGNKAAEEILNIKREEAKGKSFLNLKILSPKEMLKASKLLAQIIKGKVSETEEFNLLRNDGKQVPVEIRTYPVKIKNRTVILGMARDISERKAAEQEIKRNLKEKETLLRELYHRTKNNMQVISAMLSMQARRSDNKDMNRVLQEIIYRINSMSLVHENLYVSRDLSRINLGEYIQDLSGLLLQSFEKEAGKIKVKYDLEKVFVSIDLAMPLGLVLNELINNIFKHAFPNGQNGKVIINLFYDDKGMINLQIKDNGIGVSSDIDLAKSDSMGMETIFTLVKYQLNGKISYLSENGLSWHLVFGKDTYKKRI